MIDISQYQGMNLLDIKTELEKEFGYTFTINKDLSHGLLSTNQAFIEAKATKANPTNIANEIATRLQVFCETLIPNTFTVNTMGPYVNIAIIPAANQNIDSRITIPQSKKHIFIDYVSPNVAKEIHLGHMRNMNIGDSIRRLMLIKYPNLITDNHWGDWGVQFGKLIWAYKKFIDEKIDSTVLINDVEYPINEAEYELNNLQGLIRMYVWSTQHKDQYPAFEEEARQEFLKLEQGDKANTALWKTFISTSIEEVNTDMALFNIPKHDIEQGESYYEKYLKDLYDFFETNKLWSVDGKARYINYEELAIKTDNPSIKNLGYGYLISSTGYSTYLFRDIAARINWVDEHQSDFSISITGNEQLHHFKQLFAICNYISTLEVTSTICKNYTKLSASNLEHISYGFLTLKGGKKMSSRNGVIYNARNLYNELLTNATDNLNQRESKDVDTKARIMTLAALKWEDLGKDTIHDIEFDIQSLLNFEGNTGVYQLYTIARINSILNKNVSVKALDYSLLTPQELNILAKINLAPIVVNDAIDKLKPHIIVNYCYELSNQFNSWYNTTNVSKEENPIRKATLLILLTKFRDNQIYLLDKLGIKTLEEL
jgi:arginyl-tRNA synthetase